MNVVNEIYYSKFLHLFCCLFICGITAVSQNSRKDTLKCKGAVSATGIVQTGDENRTVFSLLSVLKIGTKIFQVEPLTSIAYSTKPGKQVEGEFLENIIFRYHQNKTFYPAIGTAFERSFLRKIYFRSTLSVAVVYNLLKKTEHQVKIALGFSNENTKYNSGAFRPVINTEDLFSKCTQQFYTRVKGEHNFKKLKVSYDIFYQASLIHFADNKWFIIGNADYSIAKHLAIRASALNSYENVVAVNVSKNNFRLTYGLNIQF